MTANPQQHVPEIEQNNQFIKEKCRGLFHQTPYHTITKKMLIAMVYRVVTQTNYFPAANGISQYFSPHTIMHKNMVDYKKIKFAFGAYVQAHNKPVQENSMMPRTLCYLKSVDSPYGGHEMLHLPTTWIICRKHITMLPITQNIIQLVHTIAEKESMPIGLKLNQTPNDVIIAGVDIAGVTDDDSTDEETSIQLEHIDLRPRKTYKDIENTTNDKEIDNEEILENINEDDQLQELYLSEDALSFSELDRMQFMDDDQIWSAEENEKEQEDNISENEFKENENINIDEHNNQSSNNTNRDNDNIDEEENNNDSQEEENNLEEQYKSRVHWFTSSGRPIKSRIHAFTSEICQ